ncbi:hypothetical protein UlMin_029659 [Ulmus minor]
MAAGRVISQKFFSKNAVHRILDRAWTTKASWAIEEVDRSERNVFRFIFNLKEDRKKIIDRGPWFLNKDLLILKEWDPNYALHSISLNTTPIWAHIYGIPLAFMSRENIWKIGEKAGGVLQFDLKEHTKWKPFVKAQLDIRVDNPLFPGFYLPMKKCSPIWIQVKYERIQDFCFCCGRLEHDRASCSEELDTTVASLDGSVV